MNKTDLARKQKRLLTWSEHALESGICEDTRKQFVNTLKEYQALVASAWKSDEISAETAFQIENLERVLESLHSESRFIASSN